MNAEIYNRRSGCQVRLIGRLSGRSGIGNVWGVRVSDGALREYPIAHLISEEKDAVIRAVAPLPRMTRAQAEAIAATNGGAP